MVWRFKREGIYAYLWLIHIVVQQKHITQHCKAIIPQLKINFKKQCTDKKLAYNLIGIAMKSVYIDLERTDIITISSLLIHKIKIHSFFLRRRQWHPTPVLLPGKSHGWRSLVGCSEWGREESDRTEGFPFHFHFHALEKEMATHASVLAWRILGTEEPGGLPSMGSHRVRHD